MDGMSPRRQLGPAAGKRAAAEEAPKTVKRRKASTSRGSKKQKHSFRTQTAAYEETTDPRKVDRPVMNMVNRNLTDAWKVHHSHNMCFIFDCVNPARRFARDMHYNEDIDFPDADARGGNVTETDMDDGIGLMPIRPMRVR